MKDARIGMISDSLVNQVFATNVFALFETIQLASRLMMKSKFGSIINMTSMIGDKGFSGQLVYSASKGAVLSMTKSAAKELAVHGIRVNAISPGVIKTDLIESLNEKQLKDITDRVCLGRIGNPNDVANLALFLASDLSNYITGQVIGVDGATII
jgi:3-oxoacyl-[acyl-carrier protein] reductase